MKRKGRIYLLMGPLGSGKTSLIRKVLGNCEEKKYAVIQNEFAQGQMQIEKPLILNEVETPFSSYMELPNGCICCSAKTDLIAAIEYILDHTAVSDILVETNGLADPAEALKTFWFDEELAINAEIESIICLVPAHKNPDPLFTKRIALGNKCLITFVDKVGQERISQLMNTIKQINPQCKIFINEAYQLTDIFNQSSEFVQSIEQLSNSLKMHTLLSEHPNSSITNLHEGVLTIYLKGKSSFETKLQVEQSIGVLLWESGLEIFRIKGALCLACQATVIELQAYLAHLFRVEDLFECKTTQCSKSVFSDETRILLIGRNLAPEKVKPFFGLSNENAP